MKKLGWGYLLISLIGAVSNMVALASAPLISYNFIFALVWSISETCYFFVSPLVSICSLSIFILACLNRLQPRRVFLSLSLCYLTLWAFGLIIIEYQGLQYRGPLYFLPIRFFHFDIFWLPPMRVLGIKSPWSGYVYWPLLITWLSLSIYGIYAFRKSLLDAGDKPSGVAARIQWPEYKIWMVMVLPSLIMGFVGSLVTVILYGDFMYRGQYLFLIFPYAVAFYLLAISLLAVLGQKRGMIVVGLLCGCLLLMVPITLFYTFKGVERGYYSNTNEVLAEASQQGDRKGVEALLANGANINAKDKFGTTALISASVYGNRKAAQLLLAKGADPNIKNNIGWTALQYASEQGHWEIVEMLIAKGADVINQSIK